VSDELHFACDLIVVGAGMAGLTAAAEAGRRGVSVVVLEKQAQTGGTARGSGGYLWTLPSLESMRRTAADGDPALQQVIFEEFPRLVDAVRSCGAMVDGPIDVLSGRGYHVDIQGYLGKCARVIEVNGGIVMRESVVTELAVSAGGRVKGVVAAQAGDVVNIQAPSTLLATGGFVASPSYTDEFIGHRQTPMRVRASRASTGDGLTLARQVGAASARTAGFYGHLVGTGIPLDDLMKMRAFGLYHSEHCLLLSREGFRFIDESLGDHMTVQAEHFSRHPSAALVWDERIQRDVVMQPWISGSPGEDRLEIASRGGARTARVAGLAEMAHVLDSWHFDGGQAVKAMEAFNVAVARGEPVKPAREHHIAAVNEPPFYLVEVSPAITFPYGGIRVDSRARVVAEDGRAIPGLLAAGSDVGGVMGPDYTGGLCTSGAFALRALSNLADDQ
jgi:succinate dehydrogenase/fumarate reductase flavoprotein subunit